MCDLRATAFAAGSRYGVRAFSAVDLLMKIVPPLYLRPPGGYAGALAPGLRSWFADSLTEPIPEALAAILGRLDRQLSAGLEDVAA